MIIKTTNTIKMVSIMVGIYALFIPNPLEYPIKPPFIMKTKNNKNRITSGTCLCRIALRSPRESITSLRDVIKYPVVTGLGSISAAIIEISQILFSKSSVSLLIVCDLQFLSGQLY